MPIHVLAPDIAAKIAAGEVIERPASVVKELVENAIDAGATQIGIEVAQGGKRLIRVSDDGSGIAAGEVELAFERHATSKLSTADELYHLQTLGFRGEALASIAAVSQLTLSTCALGEEAGTQLRIEGGKIVQRATQARPQGTTVTVENLFFNTPARLRFLASDPTEAGHISRLAASYALAYPELRLRLEHNGRQMLRTDGTGALRDVVLAIYGLDIAQEMLALAEPEGDAQAIRVSGLIGGPAVQRANRNDIVLFVNRRWIQDQSLAFAIREAYRTLLPQGRYPVAILNIAVPPDQVDVNIHPTKREVRFRDPRVVFSAVQRAVHATLQAQHPVPVVSVPGLATAAWRHEHPSRVIDVYTPNDDGLAQGAFPLAPGVTPLTQHDEPALDAGAQTAPPTARLPMLRVVGQIAQTYIVAEGPGGLYLIDQHAAHERIRYEELRAQRAALNVPGQELLEPLLIEVTPQQAALLEEHLAELANYAFEILPFGGTTFAVKRIPASLVGQDVAAAVLEMLDAAVEGGAGFHWEDQLLFTLACHTAIRAGQTLTPVEMRDLIRQLEATALPHTCPHGRPTMVHLSAAQIEREFGRH
ncbi:MAG: DNA mismatch repair endonuclease MutL [Anaerolineales bacterium]